MNRANVALLAVLAALLALAGAGLTAKPASAGHGYLYVSSYVGENPARVYWSNLPEGYVDAVSSGVNSWDQWPYKVNFIREEGQGTTLRYVRLSDDPDNPHHVGQYAPNFAGLDFIYFYNNNVVNLGFQADDKRWLGRHETGHAVRLKHPVDENAQNCCVMHTGHVVNVGITVLTEHDRSHFHGAW